MAEGYKPSLRGALSNALCNASNFPKRAQPFLLGADMSPLLDATTDAILHWLAAHDREVAAKALEKVADALWNGGMAELTYTTVVAGELRENAAAIRESDAGRQLGADA